jgi:hypothetical protein
MYVGSRWQYEQLKTRIARLFSFFGFSIYDDHPAKEASDDHSEPRAHN